MEPAAMSTYLIVAMASMIIGVDIWLAYMAFDSLNILDGWAHSFLICLGVDSILCILYILACCVDSLRSEELEARRKRTACNGCGTFIFHLVMMIWATIAWIHSTDPFAKKYAMIFVLSHLALFIVYVCVVVIVLVIICVMRLKKVSPSNSKEPDSEPTASPNIKGGDKKASIYNVL
jgi:hypothetical protein